MSDENTKITKKYYDYVSVGNRTKQVTYFVQQHDKNRIFLELLKTFINKQTLVLVNSKRSADRLEEELTSKEIKSIAIHGNHRGSQLQTAESAFTSKEIQILITTDRILEKLSLTEVHVVVNYDLPLEASDYFKRLNLVDEIGESISLINSEDEKKLATIELMMKSEMVEEKIDNFEHTTFLPITKKDKTKKPRHKKVQQRAKRKSETK